MAALRPGRTVKWGKLKGKVGNTGSLHSSAINIDLLPGLLSTVCGCCNLFVLLSLSLSLSSFISRLVLLAVSAAHPFPS